MGKTVVGKFRLGEILYGEKSPWENPVWGNLIGEILDPQNIFPDLRVLRKHLDDGVFQSHDNPFFRILPGLDLVFVPDRMEQFVHEGVW